MTGRTFLFLLAFVSGCMFASAQTGWHRAGDKIATKWAEQVSPEHPLPEYPRPQMVRGNWQSLNGLWSYSITPKDQQDAGSYQGKILVPFAIESSLSGVGKTVGKYNLLWYNRKFSIPKAMKGKNILLHFGAVDWRTEVFVNGKSAGTHEGGFDPFSFDITSFVKKSGEQDLVVKVWDPTDEGPQPRGKQVVKPEAIWYTPVTGIWQTVWIEAVPAAYISAIKPTPDIDNQSLRLSVDVSNPKGGEKISVSAWDGEKKVAESEAPAGEAISLKINDPRLWSPDEPFLYRLQVSLISNKKQTDNVKSYFAMRKSSTGFDDKGAKRMLLNNKFVFQYGPLDQGWWPDGLYTAPTDEALRFDIEQTKNMGFNMIRKHIKVEPARWYYYCDSLGILVWQDMPSGDLGNRWDSGLGRLGLKTDQKRSAESEQYYRKEWNAIMDALYPFPSIVVWTPFNEGWGQFKTVEIANWTMKKDPSRLVNSASGGNFYYPQHILDIHHYPEPAMPDPRFFGKDLALVNGEFGGLGLPVPGHVWQEKDNWGYQSFKTPDDLLKKYAIFTDSLDHFIGYGLSAAVYTQTTDVEVEINGLMTYDRKVIKNPVDKLKALNSKLYDNPEVKIIDK